VALVGNAALMKAEVLQHLLQGGVDIRGLSEESATLEEVFLEATSE
jgi:hypothetical protein